MSNQPSTFTQLLSTLPPVVQPIIRQALASAPPDVRKELLSQLEALQKLTSNNPAAYSDLMGIAKRLASPAVQPFSKIAIAGSINVGKSTLFNALTAGVSDKAEVSPVPGTTTKNQSAEMGLFNLIDTPGMNHGADSGKQESQHALDACEESDFIIAVFDATRGITTGDREIYGYLTTLNKPFIVALNKIDLISPKNRPKIIASCAASLGLSPEEINPISAEKNKGIEQLLLTDRIAEHIELVRRVVIERELFVLRALAVVVVLSRQTHIFVLARRQLFLKRRDLCVLFVLFAGSFLLG